MFALLKRASCLSARKGRWAMGDASWMPQIACFITRVSLSCLVLLPDLSRMWNWMGPNGGASPPCQTLPRFHWQKKFVFWQLSGATFDSDINFRWVLPPLWWIIHLLVIMVQLGYDEADNERGYHTRHASQTNCHIPRISNVNGLLNWPFACECVGGRLSHNSHTYSIWPYGM